VLNVNNGTAVLTLSEDCILVGVICGGGGMFTTDPSVTPDVYTNFFNPGVWDGGIVTDTTNRGNFIPLGFQLRKGDSVAYTSDGNAIGIVTVDVPIS